MARAFVVSALLLCASSAPLPVHRKNKGTLAANDALEAALAEAARELAAAPEVAPEAALAPAAATTNETHVVCPSMPCSEASAASDCPPLPHASSPCVCGHCITLSTQEGCADGITFETCTINGDVPSCSPPAGGFTCPKNTTSSNNTTMSVSKKKQKKKKRNNLFGSSSDAASTAVGVTAAALVAAACAALL